MTIQNPNQIAMSRRGRPEDWLLVIAAIWLFISPWVLGFSGAVSGDTAGQPMVAASRASWDAWILGAVIFFVALGQAVSFTPTRYQDKWVGLILGIWTFIAPWVLGFTALSGASWDHWVIGAVVFLVTAAKYARSGSGAEVPLASEPGLPRTSDPTVSPLANEPGVAPPAGESRYPGAGNINVPPEQRKTGGRR